MKTAEFNEQIPKEDENPSGLHAKYLIKKITGWKRREGFLGTEWIAKTKPVDDNSEYFILRVDLNGSDPKHIAACRKAVICYANEIKDHLPQLSKDLIERYGDIQSLIPDQQNQGTELPVVSDDIDKWVDAYKNIKQEQPCEVSDEDIEKHIPYEKPIGQYQLGKNVGYVRGAKAMRDGQIKGTKPGSSLVEKRTCHMVDVFGDTDCPDVKDCSECKEFY